MQLAMSTCQQWACDSTLSHDGAVTGLSTDSRTIKQGDLFVALSGEHFDAHQFLHDVVNKGAGALVVSKMVHNEQIAGIPVPILRVADTKEALASIAAGYRQLFDIPVVAVTGSNGKTTVKEMIASIMAAGFDASHIATRGNLNNEIGVPLTVLRFNSETKAAVVELGMNHPGEIEVLTKIAQPTVGLVNNAQREHQEFMASIEAVAKENGSVIKGLPQHGTAVFPVDDPYSGLWASYARESNVAHTITFGLHDNASVWCTYTANDFGNHLKVQTLQGNFEVALAAAGEHNVMNALAAVACSMAANIPLGTIARGLSNFAPVSGRMQRKQAANGVTVIDDTYNANPDSVKAAIDVLSRMPTNNARILVLGDMGEVGERGPEFHAEVGTYACNNNIDVVLTLGELTEETARASGQSGHHYTIREELHTALAVHATTGSVVLVKGSRFMQMEKTVKHLLSVAI